VTAAIFGLLGVVVGGVLSGLITWLLQRGQTRSSARTIARLVYDDFLHSESTLVRSLAAGHWWKDSYLLQEQVAAEDWKLLLGSLPDKPSQAIAGARGWMAYLVALWHEKLPDPTRPPPPLSDADLLLMRDVFARLEWARSQLSQYSGRSFSTFEDGGVLATIEPPKTLQQLGIGPEECTRRRKANYARAAQ
jgi:hypothetical protein